MRSGGSRGPLPPLIEGGTFVIGRGGCENVDFLETYNESWTLQR